MKSRIINLKTVLKSGEYFPKARNLKRPIFTGIIFSVATQADISKLYHSLLCIEHAEQVSGNITYSFIKADFIFFHLDSVSGC